MVPAKIAARAERTTASVQNVAATERRQCLSRHMMFRLPVLLFLAIKTNVARQLWRPRRTGYSCTSTCLVVKASATSTGGWGGCPQPLLVHWRCRFLNQAQRQLDAEEYLYSVGVVQVRFGVRIL